MPKGIPNKPLTQQQIELKQRIKTCIKLIGLIEQLDAKSLDEIQEAISVRRAVLANPITTSPAQYDGPANDPNA